MIKTETITIGGLELSRTYSDAGMRIQQAGTNAIYDEAIDPINSGRTYTETDEPIDDDRELTDTEALDVILGRGEAE